MPELLKIEEVAKALRLNDTDKVYELMSKERLPWVEGITKARLVLDEALWEWVRARSMTADQRAIESRDE